MSKGTKTEPKADFGKTIAEAYATTDGAAIELGRGVHDGEFVPGADVNEEAPLGMLASAG